jgi:hypothetical protein
MDPWWTALELLLVNDAGTGCAQVKVEQVPALERCAAVAFERFDGQHGPWGPVMDAPVIAVELLASIVMGWQAAAAGEGSQLRSQTDAPAEVPSTNKAINRARADWMRVFTASS